MGQSISKMACLVGCSWYAVVMVRDGSRMHYGKKLGLRKLCYALAMFCWKTFGPGIHVDVTLMAVAPFSRMHCKNCSGMV